MVQQIYTNISQILVDKLKNRVEYLNKYVFIIIDQIN